MSRIENVIGGFAGDSLFRNDKDNLLDGGPGDDRLYGLDGDDFLCAGSGFNYLDGGDRYDAGYYLDGYFDDNVYISIENLMIIFPPVPFGQKSGARLIAGYILVIPVESEEEVGIICDGCLAVVLILPNDNYVNFGLGKGTTASLTILDASQLPAPLASGNTLISAMNVSLFRYGEPVEKTLSSMVVSFVVPASWLGYDLAIYFWDESADNGLGAWVEVPAQWAPAWRSDGPLRYEARVHQTGLY